MLSNAAVRNGRAIVTAATIAVVTPSAIAAAIPNVTLEPRVSYQLDATLIESTSERYVIEGRGTITVTNTSTKSLETLPFHLYMNAFAKGSLALDLPFLDSRAALDVSGADGGSIEVHALRDNRDGSQLGLTFATPKADRTTAEAQLHQPIAPQSSASFDIQWTTSLPTLSQRSGSRGSFVFAGQWFPKLAKLEPDGTWSQFVFHPQAEFYANFGDYDVTLTTPASHVVGASGTLQSETQDALHRIAHYVAPHVHDFAWTAWPDFSLHEFTVDDTHVRLLFPPDNERNRDVTVDAIQKALPWFESWLGQYPLPTLTIVHPPRFAAAAGGMEYPGLITTGGPRLASLVSDDVERVVLHELAHQWFYGAVANDEYTWPFLDEGLGMYAENRAMRELYTGRLATVQRFLTTFEQYVSAHAVRHDAAISSSAASFTSFGQLAGLAYNRAALVFETFARVYGQQVDRAIGDYTREYKGHHPNPDDLVRVFQRHLGADAVATLRAALMDRGWVNYRVDSLDHVTDPNDPNTVINRLVVTRQGPLRFPVSVTLTDSEGKLHREAWADDTTQREFSLVTPTPLVEVCIDPDRAVLLDDDPSDNCRRSTPPATPPYWVELLLAFQGLVSLLSW